MGTTWVLHTETKGTGAQMVPMETVTKRSSTPAPIQVPRRRQPRPEPAPSPPQPSHRFRIVDALTREPLAEDVPTAQAVDTLKSVHAPMDVDIYVWQEERDRWRLVTLAEQRTLWELGR